MNSALRVERPAENVGYVGVWCVACHLVEQVNLVIRGSEFGLFRV